MSMIVNDSSVYFAYLGFIDAGPAGRVPGFFSNMKLDSYEYAIPAMASIAVILLRLLFHRNRHVLIFPILLLFGFVVGIIVRNIDSNNEYDDNTVFFHPYMIYCAIIVYGFYITYFVDYYAFRRNILQILPLSAIYIVCHILLVTAVVYPIMSMTYEWTMDISFFLVISLAPTELTYLLARFEGVESYVKDIQDVLQGSEVLIYAASTFIAYEVLVVTASDGNPITTEAVWQMFSYLFSLVVCICTRRGLKFVSRNTELFFIYLTCSVFFSFTLSKVFAFVGSPAVVLSGVVLKTAKVTLNASGSDFIRQMWESIYVTFCYVVFFLIGFIIGAVENQCNWNDLGFILAIYLTCYFVRLVAFMVSSFVLIRQGNQISWRHIKVGAWGVNKGSATMFNALYFAQFYPNFKHRFVVYEMCIVCLSIFFNAVLTTGLLRVEGMYDLNRSRIVNMNGAMFRINQCRERSIFSLKMNSIVSDSNWLFVDWTTRLRHPYAKRLKGPSYAEDLGDTIQVRFVKCSVCGAETLAPLTKREFELMLNDAKQRIMKTQMVSYFKQNEQETLSIEGLRYLINLIELAFAREAMLYSEDVKIQRGGTKVQLSFLNFFQWLQTATWVNYAYVPTNKLRLFMFHYTTSHQFRIFHSILTFVDIALNISMLALYHRDDHNGHAQDGFWFQMVDLLFCLYFMVELTLQLLGIGFIQYFSQVVNIVEFNVSIMVRPLEIFLASYLANNAKTPNYNIFDDENARVIFGMKFLHLLRFSRLYVLVAAMSPQIVTMLEKKIKNDVMRSYDIGKAYLMSIDRVSRILATMVNNEAVLQELRKMIEQERLKMSKELGLIQRDNPSIAVTVKTKHAIRSIFNTVNDCLTDMKEEGILDSIEHKCLLESLDEVRKELREIDWIEPCPPDFLLGQIPWLSKTGANFFLLHAELQNYDFNDVLIRQGDDPVGIFILVSGLLKCVYKPTPTTIQLSNKFGVLPNYDFFSNTKFSEPQEEIAVTGNVIGEIGLVTGRRYDMTVSCDTAVQAYFVPWETVKELVYQSPDSDIIQARIWKTIGVRITINLLEMDAHFQNWDRSKLLMYIDRGMVPILNDIHCLNLTEYLEETVLIEGVIMDRTTRITYFAPLLLPKTIRRVLLPDHPLWDFPTVYETKLLIIPDVRYDEEFIFGREALLRDHYNEVYQPKIAEVHALDDASSMQGTTARKRKAVGFSAGSSSPNKDKERRDDQ